jgi:hypothetical protein
MVGATVGHGVARRAGHRRRDRRPCRTGSRARQRQRIYQRRRVVVADGCQDIAYRRDASAADDGLGAPIALARRGLLPECGLRAVSRCQAPSPPPSRRIRRRVLPLRFRERLRLARGARSRRERRRRPARPAPHREGRAAHHGSLAVGRHDHPRPWVAPHVALTPARGDPGAGSLDRSSRGNRELDSVKANRRAQRAPAPSNRKPAAEISRRRQ